MRKMENNKLKLKELNIELTKEISNLKKLKKYIFGMVICFFA